MTENWRPALKWGIGAAVLHRILLLIWMSIIGIAARPQIVYLNNLHTDPVAQLPPLETPFEEVALGGLRRWDASHYLNLAQNGYRVSDPGPSVFGLLTPLSIRAFDAIVPGGLDWAAMVSSTVFLAVALTFLFRVCETYYQDGRLAKYAVGVVGLLPIGHFYSAPMSENLYLAMALVSFYAAARERWLLAGIFGALAALTRVQGVILIAVEGVMLLEKVFKREPQWKEHIWQTVKQGWVLALIPLGGLAFWGYRTAQGLPSVNDTYYNYSFAFFVNPIEGLFINIRYYLTHLPASLANFDFWGMLITAILTVIALRTPRHRRLALIIYTVGHVLIFVTRINWEWGTHSNPSATQSFARYTLALFPLMILIADGVSRLPRLAQYAYWIASFCGLLIFSALALLGQGLV